MFVFDYRWRICDDITKTDVKNGVIHRPSQDSDVSLPLLSLIVQYLII